MRTFVGIDVSAKRGCAVAALNEDGRSLGADWVLPTAKAVADAVQRIVPPGHQVIIGIDAPRRPANAPRGWYWEGRGARWRPRAPHEQGWGRHCEVVIAGLGLATPQWSCPESKAPAWMQLGFELFEVLDSLGGTLEVFPSATYNQLAHTDSLRIEVPVAHFSRGPKDMLDAYVGALTALEYSCGRGAAVGGGDGLGTIVLPRPVEWGTSAGLQSWPDGHTSV